MNREIKFRGWNTKTNKMVDLKKITPLALSSTIQIDGLFLPFSDEMILMQFTGLLDSKGQEIWEGDIIEYVPNTFQQEPPLRRYQVQWGAWCYTKTAGKGVTSLDSVEARSEFVVIGNIYESPELINVSEEKQGFGRV